MPEAPAAGGGLRAREERWAPARAVASAGTDAVDGADGRDRGATEVEEARTGVRVMRPGVGVEGTKAGGDMGNGEGKGLDERER